MKIQPIPFLGMQVAAVNLLRGVGAQFGNKQKAQEVITQVLNNPHKHEDEKTSAQKMLELLQNIPQISE
jgi:hypothetical protein